MLVILATGEADIWSIVIPVQPGQKFVKLHFNRKLVGVVACICHPAGSIKHKDYGSAWPD
jgi:hypothetical protein